MNRMPYLALILGLLFTLAASYRVAAQEDSRDVKASFSRFTRNDWKDWARSIGTDFDYSKACTLRAISTVSRWASTLRVRDVKPFLTVLRSGSCPPPR